MSDKRVVYKNIRKHYEELEMCLADAKAHEEWNDVAELKDRLREIETKMTADQFQLHTVDFYDVGYSPDTAKQKHKELYARVMEQEKNGVEYPSFEK